MLKDILENSYFGLALALCTLLGGYVALSQLLAKKNIVKYDEVKLDSKEIILFSVQCVECGKYVSENSENCIYCGTNQPFNAEVIMDYLNGYLYDIRSRLSLYYKCKWLNFNDRGALDLGVVVPLLAYAYVFFIVTDVFIPEEYRIKSYEFFLIYFSLIYIPYRTIKKNSKIYNNILSPDVNSGRVVLSVFGGILKRYKQSLTNDVTILNEDNKHSTGSFSPYVSFVESPSNSIDRAINRISDIKNILFVGKENIYYKASLNIEESIRYLVLGRNSFYIFLTLFFSFFLSLTYCIMSEINFEIIIYTVFFTVMCQVQLIFSRRNEDVRVFTFVNNIEEELKQIEEIHNNDIR